MTQNLNTLAQAAIDALEVFNNEHERQQREWAVSKFAKNFKGNGVELPEQVHLDLLTEVTRFDDTASATLDELHRELGLGEYEDDGRDYARHIAIADEQWDYYVAQGVKP